MEVYRKELDFIVLSKLINKIGLGINIWRESFICTVERRSLLWPWPLLANRTHKEAIRCFQTLLNDRNTRLLSADTRKENWDLIFAKYGAMLTHYCITKILTLFAMMIGWLVQRNSMQFVISINYLSINVVWPPQLFIKARRVANIRREQSLQDLVKQLAFKKC